MESIFPWSTKQGVFLSKIDGEDSSYTTAQMRQAKVTRHFWVQEKRTWLLKDTNSNCLCPFSFERRFHSSYSISKSPAYSFLFSFLTLATCFSNLSLCHSLLSYSCLAIDHAPFCILNLSSSFIPQGLCIRYSLCLEDFFDGSLQIGPCAILRGTFTVHPISTPHYSLSYHPINFLHSCYNDCMYPIYLLFLSVSSF